MASDLAAERGPPEYCFQDWCVAARRVHLHRPLKLTLAFETATFMSSASLRSSPPQSATRTHAPRAIPSISLASLSSRDNLLRLSAGGTVRPLPVYFRCQIRLHRALTAARSLKPTGSIPSSCKRLRSHVAFHVASFRTSSKPGTFTRSLGWSEPASAASSAFHDCRIQPIFRDTMRFSSGCAVVRVPPHLTSDLKATQNTPLRRPC